MSRHIQDGMAVLVIFSVALSCMEAISYKPFWLGFLGMMLSCFFLLGLAYIAGRFDGKKR